MKQVGHEKGYYLNEVDFSTAQLKITIDAIQAANFIPIDKTQELVERVAALGNGRKKYILTTNVVCFHKSKHDNSEIYANVTVLEEALSQKKKASFVYFDKNENNMALTGVWHPLRFRCHRYFGDGHSGLRER